MTELSLRCFIIPMLKPKAELIEGISFRRGFQSHLNLDGLARISGIVRAERFIAVEHDWAHSLESNIAELFP